MSDPGYTDRHHAELVEQLRRLNVGIEALNQASDRQLSELRNLGAKVEAALRFFVKSWQELRGSRGAQ